VPAHSPSDVDVRSRFARAADALLRLRDTPERTAAAFALGVFFSFSPFLGLQILLSMALAFIFRLNKLAVFVGLNANLPWFLVPWYVGTTLLAAAAIGVTLPVEVAPVVERLATAGWTATAVGEAMSLVVPIVVPFIVGPTIGAVGLGVVAFVVVRALLARRAAGTPVTA
jgi:uncharacterized protein (DUF2062 family)